MSIAAVSTNLVDRQSVQQQSPGYFQQRKVDLQQLGQDLQSGNVSAAQNDFNAIQTLGQSGPFGGDSFKVSQRQQDFAAVGQALQSGNTAGAQQALTALRQTFNPRNSTPPPPTASGANGASGGGNEIAEIVINLGAAAAAPTAAASTAATATAAPTSSSTSPTGGPEIVLNLGNATAGEQITIGVSSSANGGEQLTISVGNQQNQPPATASPVAASPATSSTAPTATTATGGPEIVLNLGKATAGEQVTIGINSGANGGEQVTVSAANQQNQTPEQITLNLQQGSNEQIVLNLFNSTNPTSTTAATQGSALSVTG